MIGRCFLAGITIGCAAGLTGCESPGAAIKPVGTVAITLEAATKSSRVAVGLAKLLAITLPPGKPGCGWQIVQHDTRFLQLHSDVTTPGGPEARATVSFVAIATGSTRLRFFLLPVDAGRSVDPIDQQEIVVTIR